MAVPLILYIWFRTFSSKLWLTILNVAERSIAVTGVTHCLSMFLYIVSKSFCMACSFDRFFFKMHILYQVVGSMFQGID